MNTNNIHTLLTRIADTRKPAEKVALLAEHAGDEELLAVLHAALNPAVTYGVDNADDLRALLPEEPGMRAFGSEVWAVLQGMADREITGNAAKAALTRVFATLTVESRDLLQRILLKDLRAGLGATTVNKAFPGLIPEFPYMRCSSLSDVKDLDAYINGDALSQEKADGMFCNVHHERPGVVRFTSRQGNEIRVGLEELADAVCIYLRPATVSMGELLIMHGRRVLRREEGNGMLNGLANGTPLPEGHKVVLRLWDQVPEKFYVSKGRYEVPYRERLTDLLQQLGEWKDDLIDIIATRTVTNPAEAYKHFAEILAAGGEGTVLKRADGPWHDTGSSGSPHQVKFKVEESVDLLITGINPGKAGTKNEGRPGTLHCVSSCGQLEVDVTIKNEACRNAIEKNPQDWIGKVAAVLGNQVTPPSASNPKHSLYLPRMEFAAYREDKVVADSLVAILAKFDSATLAAKHAKEPA